jgi:hypothetical protein
MGRMPLFQVSAVKTLKSEIRCQMPENEIPEAGSQRSEVRKPKARHHNALIISPEIEGGVKRLVLKIKPVAHP